MPADPTRLLLDFLADRDVPCPACAYNLRDLTSPTCPECGEPLSLQVGKPPWRFGWLIAALTPCMFSGIAALFLLVPISLQALMGGGFDLGFVLLDLFGLASGALGLGLALRRERFIRQDRKAQAHWAIGLWSAHIAAFVVMVLAALTM
jgi:hypothetical protein